MMFGIKSKFVIVVILGCALAIPGVVSALVLNFGNINIVTKVTSHPDQYNTTSSLTVGSPLVADLDGDLVLEIICAGYNEDEGTTSVHVWERNGAVRDGWPVTVSGELATEVAVGDLDSDGELEIVLIVENSDGSTASLYAWTAVGVVIDGYPEILTYIPSNIAIGDTLDDFSDEVVYLDSYQVALAEVDNDGKKEIVALGTDGLYMLDSDETTLDSVSYSFTAISSPVVGDIDNDNDLEMFFAANDGAAVYLYGYRYAEETLTELSGFPVDLADLDNTAGDYLSLADIDGDDIAEVLTGSSNGYLAVYDYTGAEVFNLSLGSDPIYQPVVGDADSDGDLEIITNSSVGTLYCYDGSGTAVTLENWPDPYGFELSPGLVLVDLDQDTTGDIINPVADLELLFAGRSRVYSVDMPGDFEATDIQWGMYGFDNRGTDNWLADYTTERWSIFDNDPAEAEVSIVYDWNRGSRVIELDGAGLNNCYAFLDTDGTYLNTTNTQLQWSMRYHLDFAIYVSVDTTAGRRYLYYTATEGDMLAEADSGGQFIHQGLGDVDDGLWHTFSRSLVEDLQEAEPDNEIVDVNAFYIQGSGRIDDVLFIEGDACAELTNYALHADVAVSSGEATKNYINDGYTDTLWISDVETSPWITYTWDEAIEKINKLTIENVTGATGGTIFITHSDGTIEEIEFTIDSETMEIVFDNVTDIISITIVFDTDGGSVSIGEIGVYYDPNYDDDELIVPVYSTDTYIQMQGDYFWDPTLNDEAGGYWIPHGIAYQTWVEDLGQWQSPTELRSELDEMAAIGTNALRVDFVWKHIEEDDDVFSWDNYDMLLEEAQDRGLKVFALIGYQWPPEWFPEEWYTKHPQCEIYPDAPWQSDILSYENTDVQAEVAEYLQAVASRYSVGGEREDLADTVAAWILGNEYGYLGLWSIEYDGYDDDCQSAFRSWLEEKYIDISALNEQWINDNVVTSGYLPGYPYGTFDEVDMPVPFGYTGDTAGEYLARDKASWYDLTQWREESIADYIAKAAAAVRDVDAYHLITYAAVGMQWGEEDWRYHTEDASKIVQACSDSGTPLSFWSINNYPWGKDNDELMTGKWGIVRAKHDTNLPVMITETGMTSTETIYSGVDEDRQALLIRNAIWETLETGAAGVCVFHWNDRTGSSLTERELGFGIVDEDGNPKPAYYTVEEAFGQMDEIGVADLLPEYVDPAPEVGFLWDDALDSIVNRYEAEMHQLFGALKRLGFSLSFINSSEMLAGDYASYEAIVLPRNQKMTDDIVALLTDVVLSGVKLHADNDLPGIMDEYGNARNTDSDWLLLLSDLFGVDTTLSNLDIDTNLEDEDYSYGYYEMPSFSLEYDAKALYSSVLSYEDTINMWKYRDEIVVDGTGTVLANFDNASGSPALLVKDCTGGVEYDTAISLFSLGDNDNDDTYTWSWEDRYEWLDLIYTDSTYGFGLTPDLVVTGSSLVLADYRATADGSSVLLSFKNYSAASTETVEVAATFFVDKKVEDLLTGETIEETCDGTIEQELEADGHSLLIVYEDSSDDGGEEEPDDGEEPEEDEEELEELEDSEEEDDSDEQRDEEDQEEDDGEEPDEEEEEEEQDPDDQEEDEEEDEVEPDDQEEDEKQDPDDQEDEEQEEESEDEEETTDSDADTTTDSSSSVITTTTTSDGTETGTGTAYYAAGPVVVMGTGVTTETEKTTGATQVAMLTEGAVVQQTDSHFRSYFGSEFSSSRGSVVESPVVEKRVAVPPRQQFKQKVEEFNYQQPGVIKTAPRVVTKERVLKVMQGEKKKIEELPLWLRKLIAWLGDVIHKVDAKEFIRLVKKEWQRVNAVAFINKSNKGRMV